MCVFAQRWPGVSFTLGSADGRVFSGTLALPAGFLQMATVPGASAGRGCFAPSF